MIIVGSDHAGNSLKDNIKNYLSQINVEYIDVTDNLKEDDDYPDVAYDICSNVLKSDNYLGIAICGTGIGISIACNKIRGIRAALCFDEYTCEMSRKHNNANVLCLGARTSTSSNDNLIKNMVRIFLDTKFEGNRHERRVCKISDLEIKNGGYKYDS